MNDERVVALIDMDCFYVQVSKLPACQEGKQNTWTCFDENRKLQFLP